MFQSEKLKTHAGEHQRVQRLLLNSSDEEFNSFEQTREVYLCVQLWCAQIDLLDVEIFHDLQI